MTCAEIAKAAADAITRELDEEATCVNGFRELQTECRNHKQQLERAFDLALEWYSAKSFPELHSRLQTLRRVLRSTG